MSDFELRREQRGSVVVLAPSGRIILGDGLQAFRDAIKAVATSAAKVVLDLGDVSGIDSAGLGEIVAAYTSVRAAGGTLVLARPQKRVLDLLNITKLATVFQVYDSVDAAATALA